MHSPVVADAHVIYGVHESPHGILVEAANEVSGSGGVGDGSRAQRVQKRYVVAPDLDVIENGAAAEQVERDVENVIGILIRTRHLQDPEALVERAHEPDAIGEPHDSADAAAGDRAASLRELVGNAARGELRLTRFERLRAPDQRRQPRRDLPLLSVESLTYALLHLKGSPGVSCAGFATSRTPGISDGFPIAITRASFSALDHGLVCAARPRGRVIATQRVRTPGSMNWPVRLSRHERDHVSASSGSLTER